MIKLISLFNNRIETTEDSNLPSLSNKENAFSHKNNTDAANKKCLVSNENNVKPIITAKNKWLFPDDDFGNMIKGKVHNSIVYDSEIKDNNGYDKMKIITTTKKKNSFK